MGEDQTQSRELLSPSEERDLETLLTSTDLTITDIDELSSKLTQQLSLLELENIDGLIESEQAVQDVIKRLEEASLELGDVDAWLNHYNSQLMNMRQYIEHIEYKNNRMEVVTRNQKTLMLELETLLGQLDVSEQAKQVLAQGDLSTRAGVDAAIRASNMLGKALRSSILLKNIKPELSEMLAVKEQRKIFEQLRQIFANRLSAFMDAVFTTLGEEAIREQKSSDSLEMPEHSEVIFSKLSPYRPLIHWLAEIEAEKYNELLKAYTRSMRGAYKKEMKIFFEELNSCVVRESRDQKAYFSRDQKIPEAAAKPPASPAPRGSGSKKRTIDKAFRYGLNVVETAIMSEQTFLIEFFKLEHAEKAVVGATEGALDRVMNELFEGLEVEFKELIEWADKMDHFYPLAMLVDTDQYHKAHEEGTEYCSFIIRLLNELQKLIKQKFNKFIDEQVESIRATQVSVKRCGVLPYFSKFPFFVDHMEGLRAGKEGRAALNSVIDTAYHKVVMTMFSWMDSLGDKELEKFRFIAKLENYHHFYTQVVQRKVPCLAQYTKGANDNYSTNLRQYSNYLINRQFKTLVTYFKEMDALLKTLPPDDIQYQSSHNKQALSKLMEKISASAIEKGLYKAYKNIIKNLSTQESLAPTVWNDLQNTFYTQYVYYEELVDRSYKTQKLPVASPSLKTIFTNVEAKFAKK